MSESEFTKEKLEKLIIKNAEEPARIHREMCTHNSELTKEKNREM